MDDLDDDLDDVDDLDDIDAEADASTSTDDASESTSMAGAIPARMLRGRRTRSATAQKWFRWLHVYASMISFLVVLFFGITGITLNHPNWTLGTKPDVSTNTGTLPAGFDKNGNVDFLAVSEFIRTKYGVSAAVSEYNADTVQGSIGFNGPGYAASVVFDVHTGAYTLTITQQGFVAVMNDLHKGRDATSSWKWVIDVSGGFLVFVAITGLGIQIFMRKRRVRSLLYAAGGAVLLIVLIYTTLN